MTEQQATERAELVSNTCKELFCNGEVTVGEITATYEDGATTIGNEKYYSGNYALDKLIPIEDDNE